MAIHDVKWLQKRHDWPGLQGAVMVESQREIDGRITKETLPHYLTGLAGPCDRTDDPRSLGGGERIGIGTLKISDEGSTSGSWR